MEAHLEKWIWAYFAAASFFLLVYWMIYVSGPILEPNLCAESETGWICVRSWLEPTGGLLTVVALWWAARQVREAQRQSDAATRESLNSIIDQRRGEINDLFPRLGRMGLEIYGSLARRTWGPSEEPLSLEVWTELRRRVEDFELALSNHTDLGNDPLCKSRMRLRSAVYDLDADVPVVTYAGTPSNELTAGRAMELLEMVREKGDLHREVLERQLQSARKALSELDERVFPTS